MDVVSATVLGFAGGAIAVWLVERRADRRRFGTVHRFGTARSWMAPLRRSPHQLPPAEVERLTQALGRLVAIDASALREVIGVGALAVVGDLTVELIAIEIRDAGCRGILRFRSGRGEIDATRPFTPLGEPEVTVADDLSTGYETGLAGWSGSATGGEAEFHFAPRPPADAHRLTIVIERFRESRLPPDPRWSGPPAGTPGPWVFDVEIEGGRARRT